MDTTRRDAIARNLAARICDERRTIAELQALDHLLSAIERRDSRGVIALLSAEQFVPEGDDYRRGHNAAMRRAIEIVRVEQGLSELRRAESWATPAVEWPGVEELLLGGEGG